MKRFTSILAVLAMIASLAFIVAPASADTGKGLFSGVSATIGASTTNTSLEVSKDLGAISDGKLSTKLTLGYSTSFKQLNQPKLDDPTYYGEFGGYANIATKAKFLKLTVGIGPGAYRSFDGGPATNIGAFGIVEADIGNVYVQYKYTTIQTQGTEGVASVGIRLF